MIADPKVSFANDPAVQYIASKGYEIVPILDARARGRMTQETFLRFADEILGKIPADGSVAGMFLYLGHGSCVDIIESAEMFLMPKIRERVGYDVPICIPMDFHGNMPYTVMKDCNIIVTFRTNPHLDVKETFMRGAELLVKAMDMGMTPRNLCVEIPFAIADSTTCETGAGKLCNEALDALEKIDGVWSASLVTNMVWSNNNNTAARLIVSYTGSDTAEIEQAMLDASKQIWAVRDQFISINPLADPVYALKKASEAPKGLYFVNDTGDNPTCSGVGDSAYMLSLALTMNIKNLLIGGIWDEAFVRQCEQAGEDAQLTLPIGGTVCDTSLQIPVSGRVKKLRLNEAGRATGVSFETQGITILATCQCEGALNQAFIASFGEDCKAYQIVVLKLGYLLADFVSIMSGCFMAMTPGTVDLNFKRLAPYLTGIRRPLYPFDEEIVFEPFVAL